MKSLISSVARWKSQHKVDVDVGGGMWRVRIVKRCVSYEVEPPLATTQGI